ncbi:MAG: hypothetical protein IJ571_03155 [Ruminococcus sp.]|nr:hypothetical protein [Ruminococcus sp.]
MEGYDKKQALLKSALKWVQTEFFGIFVFLFFAAVSKAFGAGANIMFGFTGLMTVVAVMNDFGLKEGAKAKNKASLHGADVDHNFGLFMGLIGMIPGYVTMAALIISKATGSFNFMPAYKLLNAMFYPLIDWAAHSANVSDMHWWVVALMAVFPLLYPISTWLGFKISFDQVDVKEKIVYKK